MATGKILITHVACLIFLLDSAGIDNSKTSFHRDKKWISWTGRGRRSWVESNERPDADGSQRTGLTAVFSLYSGRSLGERQLKWQDLSMGSESRER